MRTLLRITFLFIVVIALGYLFAQFLMGRGVPMNNVADLWAWLKTVQFSTVASIIFAVVVAIFAGLAALAKGNDGMNILKRTYRRWFSIEESSGEPRPLTPDSADSRRRFLNKTHDIWIEQKLRKSLVKQIELQLNMTVRPNPEQPHRLRDLYDLNEGGAAITVPIDQLFREKGESLLILGAPGSGKTTTLLTLAQSLIAEAQANPAAPLPLILNLSSFAQMAQKEDGASLVDWMAERLSKELSTPKPLTRGRIERREVVLLLDGLDEVAADHRSACVDAINAYVATYGGGLVVSCREKEFAELERLNITSAVAIKPFSADEIAGQLDKYPVDLRGIRQAVLSAPAEAASENGSQNGEGAWAEMLSTPLTIGMAAIAFAGVPAEQFLVGINNETNETDETNDIDEETGDSAALRQTLFQAYVRRMIHEHRPLDKTEYAPRDALHYLRNLAHQMNRHELTTFYIEWLQPTWLSDNQRRTFKIANGLIFGLISGLIFGLIFGLSVGLISGLIIGLIIGLSSGPIFGLSDKIDLHEDVTWRWIRPRDWFGIIDWKANLIVGLIFGLISGPIDVLINGLINGLIVVLSGGLIILPAFNLIDAMRSPSQIESMLRQQPNQGVYSSVKHGLISGLINVLIFGLISGLIVGLISGLLSGLMTYGSGEALAHYVLRSVLTRYGVLPHGVSDKRLVAFLDRMTEPILLRRIGGGWQFVHRYLQDYFAELSDEEIEAIARR